MPLAQMITAEATLSNAEIINLPTTPIDLVAAVPDAVIYTLFAHARMQWVADYTNISVDAKFQIRIGSTADTLFPLRQEINSSVSGLLAGGGPDGTHAFFSPQIIPGAALSDSFSSIAGFYDSDAVNKPITVRIDNSAAGILTGGDAGNSLTIQVVYMVLPI